MQKVIFSPMDESTFDLWLKESIESFAEAKVKAGTWKENEAYKLSCDVYKEILADGRKTKDQFFYSIINKDNSIVGSIWIAIEEKFSVQQIYIYDLVIALEFRRQGYGEAALLALDNKAIELSITQIVLHVFLYNQPAIRLYENTGYKTDRKTESGIFMSKRI